MTEIAIGGRSLTLTNLDRVMWPTGFTKGDLVAYYRAVARAIVPHLEGRPVMLGRWPEGVHRPGWGQWECRSRPPWMSVATLRMKDGREVATCVIDDAASLLWAVNMGTIEFHPYLAKADRFDRPLSLVFDLDPGPPAGLVDAAEVALGVRERLAADGMRAFAKSSGGEGIHVVVPLDGSATYVETKRYARTLASDLADSRPSRIVDRMAKEVRGGRVLIDWAQNDARKQTVAPYSLRAGDAPTASAPLAWSELERAVEETDGSALRHDADSVVRRLERHGDLAGGAVVPAQRMPLAAYAH